MLSLQHAGTLMHSKHLVHSIAAAMRQHLAMLLVRASFASGGGRQGAAEPSSKPPGGGSEALPPPAVPPPPTISGGSARATVSASDGTIAEHLSMPASHVDNVRLVFAAHGRIWHK